MWFLFTFGLQVRYSFRFFENGAQHGSLATNVAIKEHWTIQPIYKQKSCFDFKFLRFSYNFITRISISLTKNKKKTILACEIKALRAYQWNADVNMKRTICILLPDIFSDNIAADTATVI